MDTKKMFDSVEILNNGHFETQIMSSEQLSLEPVIIDVPGLPVSTDVGYSCQQKTSHSRLVCICIDSSYEEGRTSVLSQIFTDKVRFDLFKNLLKKEVIDSDIRRVQIRNQFAKEFIDSYIRSFFDSVLKNIESQLILFWLTYRIRKYERNVKVKDLYEYRMQTSAIFPCTNSCFYDLGFLSIIKIVDSFFVFKVRKDLLQMSLKDTIPIEILFFNTIFNSIENRFSYNRLNLLYRFLIATLSLLLKKHYLRKVELWYFR